MELQSNLLPIGISIGLVILVFFLWSSKGKQQSSHRVRPRGPANIRYSCSKCAGEFTHTNRTISAWEKGSRQFFCNTCHKDWRTKNETANASSSNLPQRSITSRQSSLHSSQTFNTSSATSRSKSPKGCLGVSILLVLIPSAITYASLSIARFL